jgi:hypothetical protein
VIEHLKEDINSFTTPKAVPAKPLPNDARFLMLVKATMAHNEPSPSRKVLALKPGDVVGVLLTDAKLVEKQGGEPGEWYGSLDGEEGFFPCWICQKI